MPDTYVTLVAGEELLIQVSDGADPEVFTHPCLINTSRGVAMTSNITESEAANCTDPSKPGKILKKVKSVDFTISGSGKVDAGGLWFYIQWWQSGLAKNIIANQSLTGAAGGFNGAGSAIIKDLSWKGDPRDTQDFEITLVPASDFVWAANA